ncbi:MAG: Hpt domain-containing protein [Chitinophagaceae bacterium]
MNNTTSAEKLFDLSILEAMDDDEYTREMISTYISDTPAELKKMQAALNQSSTTDLAKTAHKLKSSTAVFQSDKLVALLEKIEALAKQGGELINLKNVFEDINKQYRILEAGLKIQIQAPGK